MWAEKQTFGSVAEYDRYKAEILGHVRPRGSAEGKIYNRLHALAAGKGKVKKEVK